MHWTGSGSRTGGSEWSVAAGSGSSGGAAVASPVCARDSMSFVGSRRRTTVGCGDWQSSTSPLLANCGSLPRPPTFPWYPEDSDNSRGGPNNIG